MRNVMAWDRILALWRPSPDERDRGQVEGTVALERLTGGAGWLFIAPAATRAAAIADDWVPFTLRHAAPADVPPGAIEAGPFVLVVRVFATDAERSEFRRWLDQEHSVRQLTIPGVGWYLGYEADSTQHSFLNVWGIDDPAVADGEAWSRVRDTAWWQRVAHVPATADRGVFRPAPR
jgi:hypothetical protein